MMTTYQTGKQDYVHVTLRINFFRMHMLYRFKSVHNYGGSFVQVSIWAPEPCLEQPQIFQNFQKLGWRGEGEIP